MKRVYWIIMLVGLVSLGFPSAVNAGWIKTWGGSFADYGNWVEPVSYTHLTLPTILRV